ncbi:hypothetical protein [Aeromonas sp. R2-1]|uniref:hypothetical protein n=1 Tax=Aeromonas sp. R2-1 TaxID=3138459 RepID=UPI0034A1B735
MRIKLLAIFMKLQSVCKNLNRSQRFFFWGLIFLPPTLISLLVDNKIIPIALLSFSLLLLLFGIVSDLLIIYRKVWDTIIGKGVILISYAMCTTISYAFASQLVNEIVAFDSSKLTSSITFTSILLIPVFILGFSFILLVGILVFGQFYILFGSLSNNFNNDECFKKLAFASAENYPKASFISRCAIYPIVVSFFLFFGSDLMPAYGKKIEYWTSWFIYNLEAVKHSRCKVGDLNSKVININDSEIIIVNEINGKFIFTPAKCISKIE